MNKDPLLISVIMPVYNRENYIAESIESILDQTFTNFEFIIIDDASTDKSLDIIQKYAQQDPRIRFVINQNNVGPPASRNIGIDLASGKYIALMDSDDISYPDRFEKQVVFMERHPKVGVLGSNVRKIDAQGESIGDWILPESRHIIKWNSIFRNSGVICNPTAIIRRELFSRVGNYNEEIFSFDDLELWTRLFWADDIWIMNLPDTLLAYRDHEGGITIEKSEEQGKGGIDIRVKLLSKYLQRPISSRAITAYENGLILNSMETGEIIPIWFETYEKFIGNEEPTTKEKYLILKEIIARTSRYISVFPFSENKWVMSFFGSLRLKYVFGMTAITIYSLGSKIISRIKKYDWAFGSN